MIQLFTDGGGKVEINGVPYGPAKGNLRANVQPNGAVAFILVGLIPPSAHAYTDFRDNSNNSFASANDVVNYIVANFRNASVSTADLAGAAFTGQAIPLDKVSGRFQVSAANGSSTFTTAANPVVGAFAVVLINRGTEPTVTGATKIAGSPFQVSTNMEMHVRYNGTAVQYYFAKL